MKLIFLGIQGSGKSTQAKMLSEKLELCYIEMGQLLRDTVSKNEKYAGEIKEALETGILVPDNIAVNLLHERVAKPDCANGFILDGYPRNFAQLEGLPPQIEKAIYVKISDSEAIKRLLSRSREDDNLGIITKRLDVYHHETEPLLDYFRQAKILEEVDGQRSIEEIHNDIMERVKNPVGNAKTD